MSGKAGHIRATPLCGGRSLSTGTCTLLELGGLRILLDCGASSAGSLSQTTDLDHFSKLSNDLVAAGGVDAILLSHADLNHCGALPIIAGRKGLHNVPVICTYPVYKFSQVSLYDHVMNQSMDMSHESLKYDFEDIDHAFSNVVTLKYNQLKTIVDSRNNTNTSKRQSIVTVSAIASGRTIGGSIWRIRCGPAEVLYAMDVNLKREVVLDALSLDQLPHSPALMITEGACVNRGISKATAGNSRRKTKEKEEAHQMMSYILDTLRDGGNVLIPCETAGRALEVLQIMNTYWSENKIGMYHLLFLSHMAKNVVEFARCQLEWMSDSLNRNFYNGKSNPFELSSINIITNVKTMEKKFPGPKVVLATTSALNHGLSKEILLKWGGDPRSRVVFFDEPDTDSLAFELKKLSHKPPIIASVSKPLRVPLTGQELSDYRLEQEKKRKHLEEDYQRKRRQQELSEFQAAQSENAIDDEEIDREIASQAKQGSIFKEIAAKRLKTSSVSSLINSNFIMFESKVDHLSLDEFGLSNEDLQFKDIQASEAKWAIKANKSDSKSRSLAGAVGSQLPALSQGNNASVTAAQNALAQAAAAEQEVPTKLVPSSQRMQFTCEFKEFNLSGRMDMKAMKVLLKRVSPARLLVLRGTDSDCDALVSFAKSTGIEAYAPGDRRSTAFNVYTERLILQIPRTLVPTNAQTVKPSGALAGDTGNSIGSCSICLLKGNVTSAPIADTSNQEGTRLIKYVGTNEVGDEADSGDDDNNESILKEMSDALGVVCMGEVTLNTLKQLIESSGVKTEFRIGAAGGVLVCADQVIIRKDGNNFSIEGPPVHAFFEARKAIYQQFAFL